MAFATLVRPSTQIRGLDVYDDTLAAGAALEAGVHLEDVINGILSQLKRGLGETNWYDALSGRSLATASADLLDLENKKTLYRRQHLIDVVVSAGQNWEILSAGGLETPSLTAAVTTTQLGAVVAQSALSGAGFNVHELTELAGLVATRPKNLVRVVLASDGAPVQAADGRDIFGLLQYESTGADGGAFNDTSGGNRAKLSFVMLNTTRDDLVAANVADIQGLTIRYAYVARTNLDNAPEDSFISDGTFVDLQPGVSSGQTRIDRTYAVLTANVNEDVDVGGVGGGANLNAQLPDLSGGAFTTDYDVYLNGKLLRPGANASANFDFYPGTSLANGQLKFEGKLKIGDVLCVVRWS